ncbi:guanylate-binding protein 1-like [Heptranchias perlo]|uniref:guanylate-binding protein 1-like n=1 Tax=Heptranchias perlo TaxID=212740 RepID=UPI003559F1A9
MDRRNYRVSDTDERLVGKLKRWSIATTHLEEYEADNYQFADREDVQHTSVPSARSQGFNRRVPAATRALRNDSMRLPTPRRTPVEPAFGIRHLINKYEEIFPFRLPIAPKSGGFNRRVPAATQVLRNDSMRLRTPPRTPVEPEFGIHHLIDEYEEVIPFRLPVAPKSGPRKVEHVIGPERGPALRVMEEPIPLIDYDASGQLQVNQNAVNILSKMLKPVVVVAIVGLYRSGKSYLMNKLAGKQRGFPLGSTIQAQTKGIWIWCLPHPQNHENDLLLLDTEGLGDVEKGDEKSDSWIFALAVLLSSTLVYNSMSTIDNYALEKLHYITELTQFIKVKSSSRGDESSEFVRFFPAFVWSVRDFILDLKLNGRDVSADEYLENALRLKSGLSKKVAMYNLPRECIRNYFPTRKCFVFSRPSEKEEHMTNLEQLPESSLAPKFVRETEDFVDHVYRTTEVKTIKGGHAINGKKLINLAITYMDALRSGQIPCVESAFVTLAQIENSAAVVEATGFYKEEMKRLVHFPIETIEELSSIHKRCESMALQIFLKRCFMDEGQMHQQELVDAIVNICKKICSKNDEESRKKSKAVITSLDQKMQQRQHRGFYTKPGGSGSFENDIEDLIKKYRATPGKGVKAEEVLENFLTTKEQISEYIRQVDQNLTQKERKLAAEREKLQIAEQRARANEEENRFLQKVVENEKRMRDDLNRQFQAMVEKERKALLQEQEKVIRHKLEEQRWLLKEGFHQKVQNLQAELYDLRREQMKIRNMPAKSRRFCTVQ